jgi:hypothetical protein
MSAYIIFTRVKTLNAGEMQLYKDTVQERSRVIR